MENKLKFLKLDHNNSQIFTGNIHVTELKGIVPCYASHTPRQLSINVDMHEERLMELFYDIWAAVGDDMVQEWLSREGMQMISVK